MQFHISNQDKMFVAVIGILAYVFTSAQWLLWLNALNPLVGLVVYYGILFGFLTMVTKLGLAVANIKISTNSQVIGMLMVFFAIEAIVGFSSSYVQFITTGSFSGASTIFFQCEDGALFYAWSLIIPATVANAEILRWLALIISPVAIATVGVAMVKGKIRLR